MDGDNASAEEELGWEYSDAELAAAMIFEKSDSARCEPPFRCQYMF